ncbi:MAG: magnesium and cobalt exporter, family [Bryobacterales bacterium]|nr:magnesium and cobalt exporter, family [Bryobacterales bacterium]
MQTSAYIARLLLLFFILAVNAFFAAAEVALLSVRDSRLRHLAEEGHAGARMALALLANPGRLLSVTQVGVTLASLGLGWAGEDTLYKLLLALFHPILTPATSSILHAVCFVLAFALMTYCHVVIGEVVPKNLAIEKADRLAVMVAPILTVISRLTSPFVNIIEGSSTGITRILGVHADHRTAGGHSTEELKLIVSSSRFAGHLPPLLEHMIHRAIDLEDLAVREVMQPRHDVVSVPVNATLDEVLETMVQSQHSRLPVWEEAPEHMVGVVFFKDMLRLWHERRNSMRAGRPTPEFRVERIMRKPLVVPETKPLLQMLEEFRQGHTHMALIVDEFGTVSGLVTVEDVLEQIVGEIEDEFDEKLAAPQLEADEVEVSGATSIRDFSSLYGVELPANAGFETIAGYILYKLGHIPQPGESLDFADRRLTVSSMDKNRIATVLVKRISKAAGAGAEAAANARN